MTELINSNKLESYINERVDKKFNEKINQLKEQLKPKKLFTRKELKDYLRTTYPTIDRWCDAGLINKIHIGSRVYFDSDSINKLIESKSL